MENLTTTKNSQKHLLGQPNKTYFLHKKSMAVGNLTKEKNQILTGPKSIKSTIFFSESSITRFCNTLNLQIEHVSPSWTQRTMNL